MFISRYTLMAGLVLGAIPAHAILIDDFTQGPDTFTLNNLSSIEGQEDGSNIPGQQRDVLFAATANPFNQPMILNISGNSAQGATFYNGGSATMGYVQFDYDGFDVEGNNGSQSQGPGIGHLNLSGDDSFRFDFLNADGPVRVDVTAVTYGTTNRTSIGNFTTSGSITSPTSYEIRFADLSIGGGGSQQFDPGSVDRLTFRFTPVNQSGDFALASISTVPAPEPASLGVCIAGLVGLLRARRRR